MKNENKIEVALNKCTLSLDQDKGLMTFICPQKKSKSSTKDCKQIVVQMPFSVKQQEDDGGED